MIEILHRHSLSIAFLGALFVFFVIFSSDEDDILQLSGYTMGTTFQLQFVGIPENFSRARIQGDITEILERLDRQVFSTYAEQSELSRFNRSPVGPTGKGFEGNAGSIFTGKRDQ